MTINKDALQSKGQSKVQNKVVKPKQLDNQVPSTFNDDAPRIQEESGLAIRQSSNEMMSQTLVGLNKLSEQRQMAQERIVQELEYLTDPNIFYAETMTLAATRIEARSKGKFETDFFDMESLENSLPPRMQLPSSQPMKSIPFATEIG